MQCAPSPVPCHLQELLGALTEISTLRSTAKDLEEQCTRQVCTYVCVYVGNRSLCFKAVKQHLSPHSVVTLYYACEFTWFVEL